MKQDQLSGMAVENISQIYSLQCTILDFKYEKNVNLEGNMYTNIAFNFTQSVITIFLNCMVAYVMMVHAKYKTPSYFLLLNNAIVDSVFPLTLISWNVILLQVMDYDTTCHFVNTSLSFGYIFGSVSMILANIMAFDRYLAIFKPFYYHEKVVTNHKIYGPYIFAGWILSFIMVGLSFLTPGFAMFYGYAALSLSISIVFGTYVTVRIHFLVRNIADKTEIPSSRQRQREMKRRRHEYYLNKLTISMILVFLITYLPFIIYSLIKLLYPELSPKAYGGVLWAYTIIYMKSIANPLLYCISMSTIRRDMIRFLKRDNAVGTESSLTFYQRSTVNPNTIEREHKQNEAKSTPF